MDIIGDLIERINDTHAEIVALERRRLGLYRYYTREGSEWEEDIRLKFRRIEERLQALWEQKRLLLNALARQLGSSSVDPEAVIYRHSRRRSSRRTETKMAA